MFSRMVSLLDKTLSCMRDNITTFTENTMDAMKLDYMGSAVLLRCLVGGLGFVGFGTFKILMSKERQARNPHTGEALTVKSKLTPKFKFSKTFLD